MTALERPSETASSFLVELECGETTGTLTLRGVLGAASIAALETKIDQLGCMPCREVIIDLRLVTELEPIGAKVILGLYHYVVGRGGRLRAVVPAGRSRWHLTPWRVA